MISSFLNLPKGTIVDKKIDKKQFFDNGDLNSTEKKQFVSDVERITWLNRIAQDKVNIRPMCDEVRDYTEIHVIGVVMKRDAHIQRIADVIFSSFQYPLIILFSLKGKMRIFAAHRRINQNDKNRLLTEEQVKTKWFDETTKATGVLDVSKMNTANMFMLYSDIIDSMHYLRLALEAGRSLGISIEESKRMMTEIEQIDQDIHSLRIQLKEEDHFNRAVELRERIRALQKERNKILSFDLKSDPDDEVQHTIAVEP